MKSWRKHDPAWHGVEKPGAAFPQLPGHFRPTGQLRAVVLVRVTTNDGTWPDRDCILTPADWSELEHDSTVAYSTCKFGPAVKALEAAILLTAKNAEYAN